MLAPVPVAANFQLPDNYQLKYEAPQTRYSGPDEVDEEDTQKCPYRIELRPKTSHEDSFDLNTVAIGNFSQILSVQRRSDNEPFVLKAMNRVSETTYEVDILRDLDHLNILKLVDCYIFDQRCQLVLEKCTCSAVQYKGSNVSDILSYKS